MSSLPFRVQPALDDENRFFWTAGEDGVLRFLRCQEAACRYWLHPPSPRCPSCGSRSLAPEAVSGEGEVFSFTINHQSWDGSTEPYVIALVELPEQRGLRLTTNVVGVEPEAVGVGMQVRVTFEHHDPVWIPVFEPAVGA